MLSKITMGKDKPRLASLLILVCLASFVSPNLAFLGDAFNAIGGALETALFCRYVDYEDVEDCLGESLVAHLTRNMSFMDVSCCKELKKYHEKCTAWSGPFDPVFPLSVQEWCKGKKD
ncbi:hypothetical protein U1Q18_008094 [Sarracenia purpurea var. burkii]